MLTHLTINDFMLIDHLDLQIKPGMTAVTGETGTGKSILLIALGMALGERSDADRVRQGAGGADITATFLLDGLPEARQWLADHDLACTDECIIRRTVTAEGRSRAFINSRPVPLQQIKTLGKLLIDIHSQHAHQSLLSKSSHRQLLDNFGQQLPLVDEVSRAWKQWQEARESYQRFRDNTDDINARYQLLRYQVDELDQLGLNEGELETLETEQQGLANAESVIDSAQQVSVLCDDEQGASALLQKAIAVIDTIRPRTPEIASINELLTNALIHVDEARHSLRDQLEIVEVDPVRLQTVESRLSAIYDLSRKHRVGADAVTNIHQQLTAELASLSSGEESLVALEGRMQAAAQNFMDLARQLSEERQQTARILGEMINRQLQTLAMKDTNVVLSVVPLADNPGSTGIDDIEILISTNPGQPHKPLNKVASGGELSRVGLAIRATVAHTSNIATLVFDEVDVGIGGATADVVGNLLATLGSRCQVLCVTHLAQVASKAQNHWQVSKTANRQGAETTVTELSRDSRIREVARMISGNELSRESVAHARSMLESTTDARC